MQTKPRWYILIPLFIASVTFMPWDIAHPSYSYQYGFAVHYTFKQFALLLSAPIDGVPAILSLAFEWLALGAIIYWVSLLKILNSVSSRITLISSAVLFLAIAVILVPLGDTDPVSAQTVFHEYDFIWQPHFHSIMLEYVLLEMLAVIGLAIFATKHLIEKSKAVEEAGFFDSLSLN